MAARDHKRIHGCFAKRRYGTRERARRALKRAEERFGQPMRLYHCTFCRGFHLATDKQAAAR